MPTNRGGDELERLNWRFDAQDSITIFNQSHPTLVEGQFTRIVNGLFFDADESGLRTRHIKWIDFIPIFYDDSDENNDTYGFDLSFYKKIFQADCHYVYPLPITYDYQHSKLQIVNRFIELVANNKTTEPEITKFLSLPENQFILNWRFGGVDVHDEVTCNWQSEDKSPVRPDFFIVMPNGFANIVEFKLPTTAIEVVGREKSRNIFCKN